MPKVTLPLVCGRVLTKYRCHCCGPIAPPASPLCSMLGRPPSLGCAFEPYFSCPCPAPNGTWAPPADSPPPPSTDLRDTAFLCLGHCTAQRAGATGSSGQGLTTVVRGRVTGNTLLEARLWVSKPQLTMSCVNLRQDLTFSTPPCNRWPVTVPGRSGGDCNHFGGNQ